MFLQKSGGRVAPADRFLGLRAFVDGCRSPSWLGTGGALVVFALIFCVCCLNITEARFLRSPGRFSLDKEDEFPFVKAKAMRIGSAAPSAKTYRVVLIGDSAIEEAITSPEDLQRRVQRRAGRKVSVTCLLAGGMNQFEAADLCGVMQDHLHGEVVLQISPYHMAMIPTSELYHKTVTSIGVDSTQLADAFARVNLPRPRYFGNFFLRNHAFLFARTAAWLRLFRPLPEPRLHVRPKERDSSMQRFQRDAQHTYLDTKGMRSKSAANLAVYQCITGPLGARGVKVALLESPMNPRLASYNGENGRGINPSDKKAYRELRALLAEQSHAVVWDLSRKAKLVSKDFADYIHIEREPARARFTRALADQIAASIPARKRKVTA